MGNDKSLSIIMNKGEQVSLLLRRQINLTHAETEDGIEIVEVLCVQERFSIMTENRLLGDELRISSNEGVVLAGLITEPLDGSYRVGDGVMLVSVADIRPREHSLAMRD